MWGWDHMHGYDGWMGGGFGIFFMIVFWGLVILAIIALIRWLSADWGALRGGPPAPPRKTALEILEERYAKGEIDREEFQRKKQDLTE